MQINSINAFNFSAKINPRFKTAVKNYLNEEISRRGLHGEKANNFFQDNMDTYEAKETAFLTYGTPDMEIRYRSNYLDPDDNSRKHILIIHEEGKKDVILAGKEHFRALLERFYNINRRQYPEEEVSHIARVKREQGETI